MIKNKFQIDVLKNSIGEAPFEKGWCIDNNGYEKDGDEVNRLICVRPSERQLNFSKLEYYSFIHFGINTMNNVEWGKGNEDISKFNPVLLDTDQWCKVLKATGSKGIIFTAKHHDGFCLWDTEFTDHCVKNTPFKKDIVKMLSKSCEKYSLLFGIYLSPWDRHDKRYGTDEYNDYYVNQLTELCENYGKIFCFWFDGACGEGKNGKKQNYDWERYYEIIRKKQPEAIISNCGPDVHWIGNEGGNVRQSEWSVIPASTVSVESVMESSQQSEDSGKELAEIDSYSVDNGSRELVRKYRDLKWSPAEADISVTTGWFYHNNLYYLFRAKRNAKYLANVYFNSVGGNASMLLNVGPNKQGLIDKREQKTLKKFTQLINEPFKKEITEYDLSVINTEKAKKSGEKYLGLTDERGYKLSDDEFGIELKFHSTESVRTIVLSEDISQSQRVEEFKVYGKFKGESEYKRICENTVIGAKKIIIFKKAVAADEIVIVFTQSRSNPIIKNLKLFGE